MNYGRVFVSLKVGGLQAPETTETNRLRHNSDSNTGAECSPDPNACYFCNRPAQNIICHACGHTFTGRTRKKCEVHPGIIHLMDIECCPKCMQGQLTEFSVASDQRRGSSSSEGSVRLGSSSSEGKYWLNSPQFCQTTTQKY